MGPILQYIVIVSDCIVNFERQVSSIAVWVIVRLQIDGLSTGLSPVKNVQASHWRRGPKPDICGAALRTAKLKHQLFTKVLMHVYI